MNVSTKLLQLPFWFVNACEDSIMVDDVMTPLNLSIVLVEDEKFKETSLDVNVSQRPHEEESFKIVVHTQIDHLT